MIPSAFVVSSQIEVNTSIPSENTTLPMRSNDIGTINVRCDGTGQSIGG